MDFRGKLDMSFLYQAQRKTGNFLLVVPTLIKGYVLLPLLVKWID